MRFAIATLGCKVNQYDSAIIEQRLAALGMERGDFSEAAEVYIVNTCTVTDRADAESLKLARRARRQNPSARIIMTGCLAQANPAVLAEAHEVDAVVGLARAGDLERAALSAVSERVMVSNLRRERAEIELGAVTLEGHTRAFLKLQEGCDQFCSFCIVPFSRGRSRSVAPRRVIEVIDQLHERGVKEVILSGVHLGGYGKDLDPPVKLEALLEMIGERAAIGVTGATAAPYRATGAEKALTGTKGDAKAIADAAAKAADGITALSDLAASSEYRKHLVTIYAKRAIQRAIERART